MPVPKCEKDEILRKAYDATRGRTTYHVKATCIKDEGKPGKTPKSQRIAATLDDEGDLSPYGYHNIRSLNAEQRHTSLRKAITGIAKDKKLDKHDAAVKVMRRLNLLMVLNRNTNTTLAQLLERDRNWVGREYLQTDYSRS